MTKITRTGFVLLMLTPGLAGCDRANLPVTPSGPAGLATPIGVQLAGTVSDAAWRPLGGAKVEVVEGPQAGLSTTANAQGQFSLTGTFDDATRFRASKEGHVAATWPLPAICDRCNPKWWLHFYLEALASRPNLAGDYTLTFMADSSCTDLPDQARLRKYGATVTTASGANEPANSRFNVTVIGATFLEHYNSFTIGVAGDYVAADLGDWGHGGPGLVEQIAANTYLTLSGGIATSVTDASPISASFHGAVDRCELPTEWGSRRSCSDGQVVARAHCLSTNHQLILTRR